MDGKVAIKIIADHHTDQVVVTTMSTAREWPTDVKRQDLHLPLFGCMGKASSLGLGIALGSPDRQVLVLDGEGSLLMNLGALVTVASQAPTNFVHFLFDNAAYDTSGGQPTPVGWLTPPALFHLPPSGGICQGKRTSLRSFEIFEDIRCP